MKQNVEYTERTAKPDPLLTVQEVSLILEISVSTVWRHVRNGVLSRPIKLGGLTRWPRSEALEFIERAKVAREQRAA